MLSKLKGVLEKDAHNQLAKGVLLILCFLVTYYLQFSKVTYYAALL